jgi:transposase
MLSIGAATKVYLRAGPTDLRQGFEGLYQVVRGVMGHDPQSGSVFAFCNRSRTRLKLLVWDGNGLWLCTKRLEQGTFTWTNDGPVDAITAAELWALLSGLETSGWRRNWRR